MSTSTQAGTALICPRCATENPANAKFCQRCWAFLRGRHCPHCGKQATRAGAKYCEHCSRDLDTEPTTPLPLDDTPTDTSPALSVPRFESPAPPIDESDTQPVELAFEEVVDDQPPMIPIELPEAPGRPFLPPQTAARPIPQHIQQSAPPPPAPPVRVEPPAAPVASPGPTQDMARPVDTPRPQDAVRPRPAPQAQRRSGSPALTVAVVLIVFAAIGAMLALRRQRDEMSSQPAVSPTQRAAASSQQPAAAPSSLPASPAGAPTQTLPVAAPIRGTITITTTPVGAKVELDWVQVGVTSQPLTLADVAPGKHTVKVSKPGFQSQIRDVQVTPGEAITLELTLSGSASPPAPRRRPAVPPPPPPLPPPP